MIDPDDAEGWQEADTGSDEEEEEGKHDSRALYTNNKNIIDTEAKRVGSFFFQSDGSMIFPRVGEGLPEKLKIGMIAKFENSPICTGLFMHSFQQLDQKFHDEDVQAIINLERFLIEKSSTIYGLLNQKLLCSDRVAFKACSEHNRALNQYDSTMASLLSMANENHSTYTIVRKYLGVGSFLHFCISLRQKFEDFVRDTRPGFYIRNKKMIQLYRFIDILSNIDIENDALCEVLNNVEGFIDDDYEYQRLDDIPSPDVLGPTNHDPNDGDDFFIFEDDPVGSPNENNENDPHIYESMAPQQKVFDKELEKSQNVILPLRDQKENDFAPKDIKSYPFGYNYPMTFHSTPKNPFKIDKNCSGQFETPGMCDQFIKDPTPFVEDYDRHTNRQIGVGIEPLSPKFHNESKPNVRQFRKFEPNMRAARSKELIHEIGILGGHKFKLNRSLTKLKDFLKTLREKSIQCKSLNSATSNTNQVFNNLKEEWKFLSNSIDNDIFKSIVNVKSPDDELICLKRKIAHCRTECQNIMSSLAQKLQVTLNSHTDYKLFDIACKSLPKNVNIIIMSTPSIFCYITEFMNIYRENPVPPHTYLTRLYSDLKQENESIMLNLKCNTNPPDYQSFFRTILTLYCGISPTLQGLTNLAKGIGQLSTPTTFNQFQKELNKSTRLLNVFTITKNWINVLKMFIDKKSAINSVLLQGPFSTSFINTMKSLFNPSELTKHILSIDNLHPSKQFDYIESLFSTWHLSLSQYVSTLRPPMTDKSWDKSGQKHESNIVEEIRNTGDLNQKIKASKSVESINLDTDFQSRAHFNDNLGNFFNGFICNPNMPSDIPHNLGHNQYLKEKLLQLDIPDNLATNLATLIQVNCEICVRFIQSNSDQFKKGQCFLVPHFQYNLSPKKYDGPGYLTKKVYGCPTWISLSPSERLKLVDYFEICRLCLSKHNHLSTCSYAVTCKDTNNSKFLCDCRPCMNLVENYRSRLKDIIKSTISHKGQVILENVGSAQVNFLTTEVMTINSVCVETKILSRFEFENFDDFNKNLTITSEKSETNRFSTVTYVTNGVTMCLIVDSGTTTLTLSPRAMKSHFRFKDGCMALKTATNDMSSHLAYGVGIPLKDGTYHKTKALEVNHRFQRLPEVNIKELSDNLYYDYLTRCQLKKHNPQFERADFLYNLPESQPEGLIGSNDIKWHVLAQYKGVIALMNPFFGTEKVIIMGSFEASPGQKTPPQPHSTFYSYAEAVRSPISKSCPSDFSCLRFPDENTVTNLSDIVGYNAQIEEVSGNRFLCLLRSTYMLLPLKGIQLPDFKEFENLINDYVQENFTELLFETSGELTDFEQSGGIFRLTEQGEVFIRHEDDYRELVKGFSFYRDELEVIGIAKLFGVTIRVFRQFKDFVHRTINHGQNIVLDLLFEKQHYSPIVDLDLLNNRSANEWFPVLTAERKSQIKDESKKIWIPSPNQDLDFKDWHNFPVTRNRNDNLNSDKSIITIGEEPKNRCFIFGSSNIMKNLSTKNLSKIINKQIVMKPTMKFIDLINHLKDFSCEESDTIIVHTLNNDIRNIALKTWNSEKKSAKIVEMCDMFVDLLIKTAKRNGAKIFVSSCLARRDHKNRIGLNNPDNLRVKANINLSIFLKGAKNVTLMENEKTIYNDERFFNTDGYHLNSYGFEELLRNWIAHIRPDVVSVNKTDKGGVRFNRGSQNSTDKKSLNTDRKKSINGKKIPFDKTFQESRVQNLFSLHETGVPKSVKKIISKQNPKLSSPIISLSDNKNVKIGFKPKPDQLIPNVNNLIRKANKKEFIPAIIVTPNRDTKKLREASIKVKPSPPKVDGKSQSTGGTKIPPKDNVKPQSTGGTAIGPKVDGKPQSTGGTAVKPKADDKPQSTGGTKIGPGVDGKSQFTGGTEIGPKVDDKPKSTGRTKINPKVDNKQKFTGGTTLGPKTYSKLRPIKSNETLKDLKDPKTPPNSNSKVANLDNETNLESNEGIESNIKNLRPKNSKIFVGDTKINKLINEQNLKKITQNKTQKNSESIMMEKLVLSKPQPRKRPQTIDLNYSTVNKLVKNLGKNSLPNTKNYSKSIKKSSSDPELNNFTKKIKNSAGTSTMLGGTGHDQPLIMKSNSADPKYRSNPKFLEIQIDIKSPKINKKLKAMMNMTDLKPIIRVSEFTISGSLTRARSEISRIIADGIPQFEIPIAGQFKFVRSKSLLEMPIQSEVLTDLVKQTLCQVSDDLKVAHTGKGPTLIVKLQGFNPDKSLMEQVELGTEFVDELYTLSPNSDRSIIQLRECELKEHSLVNMLDEATAYESDEDIEISEDNNEFIRSAISHLIDENQKPRRYNFVLKLELRGELNELLSKTKAELIREDETQTKFIVQENYVQVLLNTVPTFDPPKSLLFRKVCLALKDMQVNAGQLRLTRNLGIMSLEFDNPIVTEKVKDVLEGFPMMSLLRISIPIVTNRNTETSSLLVSDHKDLYHPVPNVTGKISGDARLYEHDFLTSADKFLEGFQKCRSRRVEPTKNEIFAWAKKADPRLNPNLCRESFLFLEGILFLVLQDGRITLVDFRGLPRFYMNRIQEYCTDLPRLADNKKCFICSEELVMDSPLSHLILVHSFYLPLDLTEVLFQHIPHTSCENFERSQLLRHILEHHELDEAVQNILGASMSDIYVGTTVQDTGDLEFFRESEGHQCYFASGKHCDQHESTQADFTCSGNLMAETALWSTIRLIKKSVGSKEIFNLKAQEREELIHEEVNDIPNEVLRGELDEILDTTSMSKEDLHTLIRYYTYTEYDPINACQDCTRCIMCRPESELTAQERAQKIMEMQVPSLQGAIKITEAQSEGDQQFKIVAKLPLDEEKRKLLGSNLLEVQKEFDQKFSRLSDQDRTDFDEAFQKMVAEGIFLPIEDLPDEVRESIEKEPNKHHISVAPSWKLSSLSTKIRPAINASKPSPKGVSFNDANLTGTHYNLDLQKIFRGFRFHPFAVAADIRKFFNQVYLDTDSLPYQLLVYREGCQASGRWRTFVITRLTYGIKSASFLSSESLRLITKFALLHCSCYKGEENDSQKTIGGMDIAKLRSADVNFSQFDTPDLPFLPGSNNCNKSIHFAVRLLSSAFVDDLLISLAEDHRQVMINTTKYLLSLFGFECKGFDQSYQDASQEGQTTDDEGFMTVAGYRWKPSCDMLQLKTVEITNGKRVRGRYKKAQSSSDFFREHIDSQEKANEGYIRKLFEESNTKMTLRLCVSRASSIFSLDGIFLPLKMPLQRLMSTMVIMSKGNWNWEIPAYAFTLFTKFIAEICKASFFMYPRYPVIDLKEKVSQITYLWLFDGSPTGGTMSKHYMQYTLASGQIGSQLLHCSGFLSPPKLSVPKIESAGGSAGSLTFAKILEQFGTFITTVLVGTDSTCLVYWALLDPSRLKLFERNRVTNITKALRLIPSSKYPLTIESDEKVTWQNSFFWFKSASNVSDLGTKFPIYENGPEGNIPMIKAEMISPESSHFRGPNWLQESDGLNKLCLEGGCHNAATFASSKRRLTDELDSDEEGDVDIVDPEGQGLDNVNEITDLIKEIQRNKKDINAGIKSKDVVPSGARIKIINPDSNLEVVKAFSSEVGDVTGDNCEADADEKFITYHTSSESSEVDKGKAGQDPHIQSTLCSHDQAIGFNMCENKPSKGEEHNGLTYKYPMSISCLMNSSFDSICILLSILLLFQRIILRVVYRIPKYSLFRTNVGTSLQNCTKTLQNLITVSNMAIPKYDDTQMKRRKALLFHEEGGQKIMDLAHDRLEAEKARFWIERLNSKEIKCLEVLNRPAPWVLRKLKDTIRLSQSLLHESFENPGLIQEKVERIACHTAGITGYLTFKRMTVNRLAELVLADLAECLRIVVQLGHKNILSKIMCSIARRTRDGRCPETKFLPESRRLDLHRNFIEQEFYIHTSDEKPNIPTPLSLPHVFSNPLLCRQAVSTCYDFITIKTSLEVKANMCPNKLSSGFYQDKTGIIRFKNRLNCGGEQDTGLITALGNLEISNNLLVVHCDSPLLHSIFKSCHITKFCPNPKVPRSNYHQGMPLTSLTFKKNFQLIGNSKIFKKLMDSCIPCKIRRHKFHKTDLFEMQTEEITARRTVRNTYHVDIIPQVTLKPIGKRTRSTKNVRVALIVAVDRFTRYVMIQPIKTRDSVDIAEGLNAIFRRHGAPKFLYTDGESSIMSLARQGSWCMGDTSICIGEDFRLVIRISPSTPEGHSRNGAAETMIRSIKYAMGGTDLASRDIDPITISYVIEEVRSRINNTPFAVKSVGGIVQGEYDLAFYLTPQILFDKPIPIPLELPPVRKNQDKFEVQQTLKIADNIFTSFIVCLYRDSRSKSKLEGRGEDMDEGDLVAFYMKGSKDPFKKMTSTMKFGIIYLLTDKNGRAFKSAIVKYIATVDTKAEHYKQKVFFTKRKLSELILIARKTQTIEKIWDSEKKTVYCHQTSESIASPTTRDEDEEYTDPSLRNIPVLPVYPLEAVPIQESLNMDIEEDPLETENSIDDQPEEANTIEPTLRAHRKRTELVPYTLVVLSYLLSTSLGSRPMENTSYVLRGFICDKQGEDQLFLNIHEPAPCNNSFSKYAPAIELRSTLLIHPNRLRVNVFTCQLKITIALSDCLPLKNFQYLTGARRQLSGFHVHESEFLLMDPVTCIRSHMNHSSTITLGNDTFTLENIRIGLNKRSFYLGGSHPDPGKSTRGCTPTKYRTYHNFSHPYEATAGSVVRAEIELILEEEFASVSVKKKKVIMENAETFKLPQIEFPYGSSMQFFPKVRHQRELLVFTYKTGLLKACLQFLGHHTSAFLNATDESIPSILSIEIDREGKEPLRTALQIGNEFDLCPDFRPRSKCFKTQYEDLVICEYSEEFQNLPNWEDQGPTVEEFLALKPAGAIHYFTKNVDRSIAGVLKAICMNKFKQARNILHNIEASLLEDDSGTNSIMLKKYGEIALIRSCKEAEISATVLKNRDHVICCKNQPILLNGSTRFLTPLDRVVTDQCEITECELSPLFLTIDGSVIRQTKQGLSEIDIAYSSLDPISQLKNFTLKPITTSQSREVDFDRMSLSSLSFFEKIRQEIHSRAETLKLENSTGQKILEVLYSDFNQNILNSIYLSFYGRMMLIILILWNVWVFSTGIFNFLNRIYNMCQRPVKPNISVVGFLTGTYQMINIALNPLALLAPPPPPCHHHHPRVCCQSQSQLTTLEIEELVESRLSHIRVDLEEAQKDLTSIRQLLVRLDSESLL